MVYRLYLQVYMIVTSHVWLLDLPILSSEAIPEVAIFDHLKITFVMICIYTILVTVVYLIGIVCLIVSLMLTH